MNTFEIAEVNILPVKPQNGLVAFASLVINNRLYVGNIAVYTSPTAKDGFRLVYPEKVLPNGKRINCVYPITQEAGEVITKAVIERYLGLMQRASY
jgi:stage V sporulation protein G